MKFNKGQRALVFTITNMGEYDSVFVNSAGGTGKTTVVSHTLKDVYNVVALGPTHQSVQVLKKSFTNARTFHSFFGWNQTNDDFGNCIINWLEPDIKEGSVFVLDEISMMDDCMYSLYRHYIKGKYKVILMGDIAQLDPVKTRKSSKKELEDGTGTIIYLPKDVVHIKQTKSTSLFFDEKYTYNKKLTQNMRSENKELSEFLGMIRECTIKNKEVIDLTDSNYNKKMDEEFLIKQRNLDFIVLCHSNKEVDLFNNKIRKIFFPETYLNEINDGDKMIVKGYNSKIFHSNYRFCVASYVNFKEEVCIEFQEDIWDVKDIKTTFNFIKILTTEEDFVTKVIKEEEIVFGYFFSNLRKFINRLTIEDFKLKNYSEDEKEIINFNLKMENKLKNHKQLLHKKIKELKKYYHCPMKHSFAATVHSSQGMGFDSAIVYNSKSYYFSNKSKYTSASRAKKNLYIVSD